MANATSGTDVAIVGGGVVGAAIAYFAARRGMSCVVLDKGAIGSGASNAASGLLSASPGDDDYANLSARSLALFHELAPQLRDETGVDIEFDECGDLLLALSEEDVLALQAHLRQVNALGGEASWLDSDDLRAKEPALSPAVAGAILEPRSCRVNNQRLSNALATAAARHGADIRQGVEVTGIALDGTRATGLNTSAGNIEAGNVVLAAGAWTGLMDRWLYGARSPSAAGTPMVKPMRGVNLNLQPTRGGISCAIHGAWGVFVPRKDGSLIAGATVEDAGFDARVTADAVQSILGLTCALMPTLRDADFNWALAGLRPGSADDYPVIGAMPGFDNVFAASGHFRNGILLSLATGEAIADMLEGDAGERLTAFNPARFL